MILEFVADLLLEVVVYPVQRAIERGSDWLFGRAKRLLGRGSAAESGEHDGHGKPDEHAERDGDAAADR